MIEFMQQSSGNILGIRASGKITDADYKLTLIPRLESLLNQHGKLRVLFFMDEKFDGWDLRAAWDNTSLDFRHRADFDRIAMVGASALEECCARLAGFLIKGEIRTFRQDQLAQAWEWLRA
jgi:SpoIIAA-like